MSDDNKKRKLEEENTKEKHSRFENLFKVTPMDEIVQHLVEIGKNPDFHKFLDQIFPESDFPLLNLTDHCVRCHNPFDPNHNSKFKCWVPHHGEIETKPSTTGSDVTVFTYTCCGQSFEVGPNQVAEMIDPSNGICQKSNHTTNTDYVENYVSCDICGVESEDFEGEDFEEGGLGFDDDEDE